MERIKLNLVPTGMVENVHASQYDIARTFRFDLMDGESVFTLDGTETITVDVTKPDGTQTTISVDNTSSSYVDVVTPAGVCDLSGSANCELRIVKGGEEIGSQNFSIKIESDPHDDKIVLRTASGIIASFNTDLGGIAVDVTSALPYTPDGYTSATVINSKTTPVFDLVPYLTRANTNTGNLALEKLVGLTVCFNQLVNTGDTSINGTKSIIQGGSAVSINDSSEDNIIDLTAMFGSEVADYLYTLESGTAGAGVSIFKSLFGADYYPYTANTLMSAKPTGKKIYSKNLFNGTYDTIFQLPFVLKKGTTITASAKMVGTGTAYIQYLNASQTMIDYWGLSSGTDRKYRTFTLDADTYYFKFTSVEVTEMQIEINGEATAYEPYSETTIVYSGNELRGLLKVGTNGLYADGDIDDGSGSTSGRCDICDFSDNEWSYKDGLFSTQIPNFKSPTSYNDRKTGFLFEDYYLPDSQISISSASMNDKRALRFNERIYIKDTAFSDAVSFTAHMNNVKMLYELATPTTATSTAWSNPIQAKQGGTETFVDGNFYGCVDLGSLNYSYDSPYSRFIATVPNNRTYTTAETPNLIVSGYKAVSIDYFDGHLSESMMICGDNNSTAIYIRNLDYTDATAFKNAMSGTYLFYEISTSTFELPTGHDTIYGTDMVVKKADFGQTVYGGSVDFTTGEVISNKNADGSDKTPEAIAISPVMVGVFEGNNNIVTTAGGNNTVKYYKGA